MSNDQEPENDARAEQLSDDLLKKYDPERLLKIVSRRAGRGDPLDAAIRAKYEKRFGVDLSHVRIYSGEFAEEFNKQRNAYAVTIGSTGMILMGGSGDKAAHTKSGEALLAHELTHVAQARKALSFAAPFATGGDHEAEAEAIEHEIQASGGPAGGASGVASNKPGPQEVREALEAAIDKIKARVMEMITDQAVGQLHRSSAPRRA